MSGLIRPRRAGLIVFSSRIVSVFTGLIFLVMITRWLPSSQFGLWEVILDILAFASYPVGLITYWATREIARGRNLGKTTIATGLLLSVLGVLIFLFFALTSYGAIGSGFAPFAAALVLVPLSYWSQATNAIVNGRDPGLGAFALLASEVAKVASAYPLLFIFKLHIFGVIAAIGVAYVIQAGVGTYLTRRASSEPLDLSVGKRWLTDAYVPAIAALTYLLPLSDTYLASLGSSGTTLAGYYQAAYQIATTITYSTFLSVALYPLLLRGVSEKLASVMLDFTLLFSLPMTAGIIALAPKILYLLNPTYVASSPALVILAAAAFVMVLSSLLDSTLLGLERADLERTNRMSKLLRSNLTFVSAANLAYSSIYALSIFLVAKLGAGTLPLTTTVTYWASIQLALNLVLVGVKARRASRASAFSFGRSSVVYVACAVSMSVVVYTTGSFLINPGVGTLEYGVMLLLVTLLGVGWYFGLVLALLPDLRRSAKSLLFARRLL